MSTDDKWLEIGEMLDEFNEHAPRAFEHRVIEPVGDWQTSKAQFNFYLRDQIKKEILVEDVKASIQRLLRGNPF